MPSRVNKNLSISGKHLFRRLVSIEELLVMFVCNFLQAIVMHFQMAGRFQTNLAMLDQVLVSRVIFVRHC